MTMIAAKGWEPVAAEILAVRTGTVLVVGAGDTGKSTFARWLIGRLLAENLKVQLIDCDLGQKTVGPPAAVTLGDAQAIGDRTGLSLCDLHFVGRTHPIGVAGAVLAGLARLRAAATAGLVIIDTCGLVAGAGVALKQAKLDLIAPDVLCAIERGDELAPLLEANRHRRIVRLRPAGQVRPKSASDRRAARAAAFAAHLRTGRPVTLAVDGVAFQRAPVFIGTPVALEGAVYAERIGDAVVAVCPAASPAPRGARWLRSDFARSLLCGLGAGDGRGLGLGLIEDIDFAARTVTVTTPAAAVAGAIRTIRLGDLYVDRGGTEIGRADFSGILPG